jgi:hypothetical protein
MLAKPCHTLMDGRPSLAERSVYGASMSHAPVVTSSSLAPTKTGVARLVYYLPRGRELTDSAWGERHCGILVLLWLHGIGVPLFGLMAGNRLGDSLMAGLIILGIADTRSSDSSVPCDARAHDVLCDAGPSFGGVY